MFELLFQYPRSAFSKGDIVLLGSWPKWLLILLVIAGAAGLGYLMRARLKDAAESVRAGWRPAVLWVLQSTLLAVVLTMLWQPALLVSTLKPQQNVVAVLVDDSLSMGIADEGSPRLQRALATLDSGVLDELKKRFQTRVYRVSDVLARIQTPSDLKPRASATHIADGLQRLIAESAGLPLGAVVLLSDGGDNAGGIDLATITELRNRRVPVHAVGYGKVQSERDLELDDAQVSVRTLADSRIAATVSFHHRGLTGRRAKLWIKESGKLLASRDITLGGEGVRLRETLPFNAGAAGAKSLQVGFDLLDGETNTKNNWTTRLVSVENNKPRILYVEGEPRWEYKFIRRALEDDKNVTVVSMLRTTQNKLYWQGTDASERFEGFPATVEELFKFQGIIIGSVEAAYFTPKQMDLLKTFVDRRGGGVLWMAGRAGLADGGWGRSAVAEMLPTSLPDRRGTFVREPAKVELTPLGVESLIPRLADEPKGNVERWKKLPALTDYQDPGAPKPGAAVLVTMNPGEKGALPFLTVQNYGRGRTAILAGGTWKWQMLQPVEDKTHEMFWQQLLRWLVSGTPGRLIASTPRPDLFDDGTVKLTAEIRDKNFLNASDAKVEARIIGPEATGGLIEMTPDPTNPGVFHAEWNAAKAGSYIAEVTAKRGDEEAVRDAFTFQRQDGVAENFRTEQNRDLLEKLATQTGGRYWTPAEASKLPSEITYSDAGITIRETRDLWNMPAVFLVIAGLRAAEWLLRRRWGIV